MKRAILTAKGATIMRQGEVGQFGVPFSARDKNSSGLDVVVLPELTRSWAEKLGRPVEIQQVHHPAIMDAGEVAFRAVVDGQVVVSGPAAVVGAWLRGACWGVENV